MFKKQSLILLPLFLVGVVWLFFRFIYMERHDVDLAEAISAGDLPAAQRAFDEGATMRMQMRRHFTFLQVAALHTNVQIAKLLMDHGAVVTLTARNDDGNTALDIALAQAHIAMADYLRSFSLTSTNHERTVR
jgi:ankyrin repeat protein